MNSNLRTVAILLGVLGLLIVPATASHWRPGDGNPAASAAHLGDNAAFHTGVFANGWSPFKTDHSSNSGSSTDTGGDGSSSNSGGGSHGGSVFNTGVFADNWAVQFIEEHFGPHQPGSGSTTGNNGSDNSSTPGNNSGNTTGDNTSGNGTGNNFPGTNETTGGNTTTGGDTTGDNSTHSTGSNNGSDEKCHTRAGCKKLVKQLWGGHTPWEGTQPNENYCYTMFYYEVFDQNHCGWELNVPKPPEHTNANVTEARTLTKPKPPESLGVDWISWPNPQDVMPNPYTAEDQASVKVCAILLNQANEPITGHTVPGVKIAMPFTGIPYPKAHPVTFKTPLHQYGDMIGHSDKMPPGTGDGWLDSDCMEFANLPDGNFTYGKPQLTGSDSNKINFVGVTEYWDVASQGNPYDERVFKFGQNNLSDGKFSLHAAHYDTRHAEIIYLFRLK